MEKFRKFAAIIVVAMFIFGMVIPLISSNKVSRVQSVEWDDTTDLEVVEESEAGIIDIDAATEEDVTACTDHDVELDSVSHWMELTEDEIWTLATTIYLEGRGESYECQQGICSVILNRMITRDQSLTEVVYAKNQFSVASNISSSRPDDRQIDLVRSVLADGTTLPLCVTFFRAGYYHNSTTVNTKYILPYIVIDNTYFSHDIRICGGEH